MMKSVMKVYLHGKIDEQVDSVEGHMAQSIHSSLQRLDSFKPVPLGE